jgi:hypothetical protein
MVLLELVMLIFLTSLVTMLAAAVITSRDPDPAPRLVVVTLAAPVAGPIRSFPVDTEPLILWSEHEAALAAHEREVRALTAAADRIFAPIETGWQ